MAKLTARFDMQDRITKKIRTIRGEIDKLERARANVNKPVTITMRARDMATNILKRLHIFVLKDIAKTHTVTVRVKDGATKVLTSVSNFMKRRMPRTHALFVSAKDRATPILQRIGRFTQRNIARTQLMTILATDRAMPIIRRVGNFARSTLSRGYNFTVRGIDMASRIIGRVGSYAATAIPKVQTFTIRAINMASNVIGSVKSALFSIPTVITVTLAAVGIGSLAKSTIGSSMNFEDYGVSMDHWLKGDKKASAKLMEWMGQKADLTPYNSADIFPAMVGAVSLAGGNLDEVKRLTSVAIDMAALTPGRTVEDAMQALKNVKMGEYSMMSGFGKDLNKKMFEKMGWEGFIKDIEVHFQDGALKLSDTGRGQLNMLQGYMSSQFRSMGDGILERMKPRLQAITQWLLDNPKAWAKWKKTVEGFGAEAGEWIFSKLEKGFSYIKNNYLDNEGFKKLNFEGKIKFIADDISEWWSSKGKPALNDWWKSSGKPWAEKVGLFMGESIFNGIVKGVKEGGKALAGMWGDALKKPSLESLGGAGVATLLAVSIASLVLSPLITAISLISKGVQGAVSAGKKISGLFKKTPTSTPTMPVSGKTPKPGQAPKQVYRMPWTNKGEKPILNVPNSKNKGFKIPKGLSNVGKFVKGIPVLGTALGALAIATSSKEDRAGTIGGVGGGLAGAATGAAVGSVIPGIGTAIGGIIGGVVGSLGGNAIGDWLSDNWTAIKEGASSTGKWISDRFNDAKEWVSNKWSSFTDWFSNSVWNPVSEGASAAVDWIKEKWNAITGWFNEKIWTPLTKGFDTALNFIVGLYDIAEQVVKFVWGEFSQWFNDTVWTPLKEKAGIAWDWITNKINTVWEGIKDLWGIASSWFMDSVWTPLLTITATAWEWMASIVLTVWKGIQTMWGTAVSWFEETIWTPLMMVAGLAWFAISTAVTTAWTTISELWGTAVIWFEETIWTPLKTAAEVLGTWIGDKFTDGWNAVVGIWEAASAYFEENIWAPIKAGAALVEEAITTPFKNAWEYVSGIFTKLGDTWDTIKKWGGKAVEWGGNAVDYVVERGKKRREGTPTYAQGTNFHPGGPAIVGDGGGPELIRYPSGNMSLSPGTDTMMNLPRGTEVLSHRKTLDFFNAVPAYADGVGFGDVNTEKDDLTQDLIEAATRSGNGKGKSISGRIRDIIIQITGDHHYSDDEDFDTFKQKVVEAVTQALEEADFEGGGMVIDG